jgi:choline kinase
LSVKEGDLSKQYCANVGKRAIARSPVLQPMSSPSLRSQASISKLGSLSQDEDEVSRSLKSEKTLFTQVLDWLEREKSGRAGRKPKDLAGPSTSEGADIGDISIASSKRRESQGSERALALEDLEKILHQYVSTKGSSAEIGPKRPHRRRPKGRRSASESDYSDIDGNVPSVDAALNNSRTLSYTDGVPAMDPESADLQIRRRADKEPWLAFKTEILRLTHTLQLKGWRRIPTESSKDIEVTRLSGALTNAVYVVIPPRNLPHLRSGDSAPRRPA